MMKKIQTSHHKVVLIDTESSGVNVSEEEIARAAIHTNCEHKECHRLECKVEKR